MSFALFVVTTLLLAQHSSATTAPTLAGTWRSTPDEMPLSSAFDESVWGKNAKAIRTVEMIVRTGGDASLTVTRKVVDARGRTVLGSTSIEEAELSLGPVQNTTGVRSDLMVTVKKAERRYPDDPKGTFDLQGLQVTVTTFTDDAEMLEVRVDFPEGRGSFWEALRRGTRKPATAKPATTKPATTKPATTKPATTKPATTKPATTP